MSRTDLENKRELIKELDLEPIVFKLVKEKGWELRDARMVEVLYRQFLFLNVKYEDRSIVPTEEVDEFWHQHILDTRKYAVDCEHLFGGMLHHFPYLGIRGGNDAEVLQTTFAGTKDLWKSEFGGDNAEGFVKISQAEVMTTGFEWLIAYLNYVQI